MQPEIDNNPHGCQVPGHGNRLGNEKSPYLRQHAQDPVAWYPWGDEAFARAQQEDKPVFLSIGYSTCHWCHVMARESFRDAGVAKLLNESFIAVKVDREERPDIDRMYMTACQAMTGTGGWPLSLFLTPEKKPFFAATYIPKDQRSGSPGMMDLLPRIAQLWKEKKNELLGSAAAVSDAIIASLRTGSPADPPGPQILTDAFEMLVPQFDPDYGGFGPTPKFPMPSILLFLLRYWKRTGSATALLMVTRTLDGIFQGGIYDQVGGGVHRYSTDGKWRIPHFEKMLYDQALLAIAFTEAFLATGNSSYRSAAMEILAYMRRDLRSPDGAFFSAEDADSPGGEGAFYVWTAEEFARILMQEDEPVARAVFNVTETGLHSGEIQGNVLYRSTPAKTLAERFALTPDTLSRRIETIKSTLFAAREKRPRPMRDEKILADWNGFAIAAFARAAQAFGSTEYASVAAGAASLILASMRMPDGGIYHRYCCGESAIEGFADDYSGLVWGLTELYEATFDDRYLDQATDLTRYLIAHFHDPGSGCFFSTADTSKDLLVRTQEFTDGVVPSANSLAFYNLLRLSRLTGETGFEDLAGKIPRAAGPALARDPSAFSFLLCGLDFATGNPTDVVIAGQWDDPGTAAMIDVCRAGYYPSLLVRFHNAPGITGTIRQPLAQGIYHTRDGKATAYLCTRQSCLEPVTDAAILKELLESPGNYRASGK